MDGPSASGSAPPVEPRPDEAECSSRLHENSNDDGGSSPAPEQPPPPPPPPVPPGSDGGVHVLLDGAYVFIPPDSAPASASSSAAASSAAASASPRRHLAATRIQAAARALRARRRVSVLIAKRELCAAIAAVGLIGKQAQPQADVKKLQLADALLAAGHGAPAELLYESVFEFAGAAGGGRCAAAERAARGLGRIYRARGEHDKAYWVRFRLIVPHLAMPLRAAAFSPLLFTQGASRQWHECVCVFFWAFPGQIERKPDPTPLEHMEAAWGAVAGALAQIPEAWDGAARALMHLPLPCLPPHPPLQPVRGAGGRPLLSPRASGGAPHVCSTRGRTAPRQRVLVGSA